MLWSMNATRRLVLDSHCHPTCLSALLKRRAAAQAPLASAYELQPMQLSSDPLPAQHTLVQPQQRLLCVNWPLREGAPRSGLTAGVHTHFSTTKLRCCRAVHGCDAVEALFAQFEPMERALASAGECPADATACEQPSSTAKKCWRCKPHSISARRVRWDAALLLCILCGPRGPAQGCTHHAAFSAAATITSWLLWCCSLVHACNAAHVTSF
jgi:hypothetical protein